MRSSITPPRGDMLFAPFLDGLRGTYVRDGMRGVMAVAPAADRAMPKQAAAADAALATRNDLTIGDIDDDERFEALVDALEEAFLHGGREGAIRELSRLARRGAHKARI
jgi:hypothetical protein